MSEMTTDFFMDNVIEQSRIAGVEDTVSKLTNPPGRRSKGKRIDQSEWFNSLSLNDQRMVKAVMYEAVDESLFGLFVILDSVRTIDDDFEDEGYFELHYVNNDKRVLINDSNGMDLHDEYNARTNPG